MRRITVVVPDDLHTQFKVKVAQNNSTVTDVVTQLVADYVAGRVKVKTTKTNGRKAKT